MNHPCNYILKALEMTNTLLGIADKGEAVSYDDSYRILFGVIRDCAYKIQKQAERQCQVYKAAKDRRIN